MKTYVGIDHSKKLPFLIFLAVLLTSVCLSLHFYSEELGFRKSNDIKIAFYPALLVLAATGYLLSKKRLATYDAENKELKILNINKTFSLEDASEIILEARTFTNNFSTNVYRDQYDMSDPSKTYQTTFFDVYIKTKDGIKKTGLTSSNYIATRSAVENLAKKADFLLKTSITEEFLKLPMRINYLLIRLMRKSKKTNS